MSERESKSGRTFSLLKTLSSTAIKASGEAIRKKVLGEELEHSAAAERLASGLDDLKGAAMKIGQLLSLSPEDDVLPRTWKLALSKLQSEATAKPWEFIQPILHEAFGEKLPFARIEEVAVHAASIAQVHRAWLEDGTPVAVKVRYPNLEKNIRSDIDNMRTILKFANVLPSKNTYDEAAKVVEEVLAKELDFNREREYYEFYKNALAKKQDDFFVPRTIPEACRANILTTEWVEGENVEKWITRLNALPPEETQDQRNTVGGRVLKLLFVELFTLNHIQTDPNPGNFLILPDNRIALLDFGATQPVSKDFVEGYAALTRASLDKKPGELTRRASAVGFLKREDNETARDAFARTMTLICEPFVSSHYSWKNCNLAKRVRDEVKRFAMASKFRAPPSESIFINRRILGNELIMENIGPEIDARQILLSELPSPQARETSHELP